jgi:hypothetical protein
MKTVLAVDLGTFCDNKLMEFAMLDVAKTCKVVYLTDKKHQLDPKLVKVPFDTPSYFTNDPKLEPANTATNMVWWVVRHPLDAWKGYQWTKDIQQKLESCIEQYKPCALLVLYPAISILWLHQSDVPVYVLYYAPGIPNWDISWLFDSRFKDPRYKLYKKSQENVDSGMKYLTRIAGYGTSSKSVEEMSLSVNHVLCWNKHVLPKLDMFFKDAKTFHVGTLVSRETRRPRACTLPLKKKGNVFLSFGSYGNSDVLHEPLQRMLKSLNMFAETNGYDVWFHLGGNMRDFVTNERLTCINILEGYIPYEDTVPRMDLVIFTGSVCLQNICLYNATPMLFFPLLNEQFYWARNYKHNTGTRYLDHQKLVVTNKVFQDAIDVKQRCMYLQKIRKSMVKQHASRNINKLIQKKSAC